MKLEVGTIDLSLEDPPAVDTPEGIQSAAQRLSYIADLLTEDNVSTLPMQDVKANLEFAIKVLQNRWLNQPQLHEEDDEELSSPANKAHNDVPHEVREWLASTFTRKLSAVKRPNDKPKFRSVANAIRAGIFVERIFRRMSNSQAIQTTPEIALTLRTIDEWSFDVFAVSEASNGQALRFVANEVLTRYDLPTKFKVTHYALESFLMAVETGYSKHNNPYHNSIHAADVTQTMHWFLYQTGLAHWLSDLEIFASLIGAIIHDFEHTGTTNNFHVQSHSPLAMLYNDRSVLENHHLSAAFLLMQKDEHNILAQLTKEEYRDFRSLVIEMVLATDMSIHFQHTKSIKALLTTPELIDKAKALQQVLHSCDVSHPAKPWPLHHRWTGNVLEEFFQQGDRELELGLPFSPLCDRQTTAMSQSQIGFIDFIVEPSMIITGEMLEKILQPLHSQVEEGLDAKSVDGPSTVIIANEKQTISLPSLPTRRFSAEGLQRLTIESGAWPHMSATTIGKNQLMKKPWLHHLTENKAKWKQETAAQISNTSSA